MIAQGVQLLCQAAQWIASSPSHMQMAHSLMCHCSGYFQSLSSKEKQQMQDIIRWGAGWLSRVELPEVLRHVEELAVAKCGNPQAAEFAKGVVSRAAKVGLDAAMKEAGLQ